MTDKFNDMEWEYICAKCGLRTSKKMVDCKREPYLCDNCSQETSKEKLNKNDGIQKDGE